MYTYIVFNIVTIVYNTVGYCTAIKKSNVIE
jgi:hypothetical protein